MTPNASDQRLRNSGRKSAVKRSAVSDGWASLERFGASPGRAKVKLNERGQLTANEPSSTSFSILRMILPEDVVGTEVTNCTARGTLYAARCSRQ